MIQLNLLPDVKLEYIKAERSRKLVLTVAVLVSVAAIALLLLMLSIYQLNKKHSSDLDKDISSDISQLQKQPQINRVLTVQNQLDSLTTLHDGKPAVSRVFDYFNQLTPNQVSVTNLKIDFAAQAMTITGKSDSLGSVNAFVDTLKFTTYRTKDDPKKIPAFANVVLSSFSLKDTSQNQTNQPAEYTITSAYDQPIFDNTKQVTLTVPSQVTTRSEATQPTALFQPPNPTTTTAPTTTTTGGQ